MNYVLMVSGNRFEKNVYRALMAIQTIKDAGAWPDLSVAITGGSPRHIPGRMRQFANFLPYLPIDELAALYRSARLLIYPTLNEGFGYPPIESLSFDTPVVASGLCSIPEINRDAIQYFDPRNHLDIAARVSEALDTPRSLHSDERRSHIQRIRDRQTKDLDQLIDLLCATASP